MSKLLARAKAKQFSAENSYKYISVDDAYIDECCFNLHQAIEFSLKYLVEMYGERYIENHDIRAQMNKLKSMDKYIPCDLQEARVAVERLARAAHGRCGAVGEGGVIGAEGRDLLGGDVRGDRAACDRAAARKEIQAIALLGSRPHEGIKARALAVDRPAVHANAQLGKIEMIERLVFEDLNVLRKASRNVERVGVVGIEVAGGDDKGRVLASQEQLNEVTGVLAGQVAAAKVAREKHKVDALPLNIVEKTVEHLGKPTVKLKAFFGGESEIRCSQHHASHVQYA
ncbi:MAG: HEPN domain-containing protein [Clostridia bacterium]|nr:HEPN domain-containing protein [Clostridia bacterium]